MWSFDRWSLSKDIEAEAPKFHSNIKPNPSFRPSSLGSHVGALLSK